MRNMRGALGALMLAGAAYAWRNRGRLGQQLNSFRGQMNQNPSRTSRSYDLPDLSATEQREFNTRPTTNANEREFGGTST